VGSLHIKYLKSNSLHFNPESSTVSIIEQLVGSFKTEARKKNPRRASAQDIVISMTRRQHQGTVVRLIVTYFKII
jgi:hypothetical protein